MECTFLGMLLHLVKLREKELIYTFFPYSKAKVGGDYSRQPNSING